ncbi:MAG: hypothetical protein F4Y11_11535 [Chloroflexi bacterium]|nr:hypothetical protein [Chloroflexota bacterium]
MMLVGLGEILVVLIIRPLRFVLGGERTPVGRAIHRFERWLLDHLHVMGAEARMTHELDLHGQATSFLAQGISEQSGSMPSMSDTVQRVRDETGANIAASQRSSLLRGEAELKRGQRQVASTGGDRSEEIHEAMLRAQREQRRQSERGRRLRGPHRR